MDISCKERILSNDYADWIIDFNLEEIGELPGTETADYCYRRVDDELGLIFAARTSLKEVGLLNYPYRQIPAVFGLQPVTGLGATADYDPGTFYHAGITQVQRLPLKLSGKGVVIAIIGTGIDYMNPVFRNQDGSSRILSIWDQTIQEGTPPLNFVYGTEYKKEEIEEAIKSQQPYKKVPSRDTNGHGTYMASIAAGSNITEPEIYSGAAPEADIVVVKLKECKPYLREYYLLPEGAAAYQSTDIIMAVQYVEDFARAFSRPIVICLGLGSNLGGHSGSSPLSRYLDRVGDKRGRVIVVGGGSEGNTAHHYFTTIDPLSMEEGRNNRKSAEIRVGDNEKGFLVELWVGTPNLLSLSVRTPGGEVVSNIGTEFNRGREYRFLYEKTRIIVTYTIVEGESGDQLITIRFENPTPGIWAVEIENERGLPGAEIHMWLPLKEFLTSDTYFLTPSPEITLTQPSYAANSITTSAYADKTNSFYVESGRGFSRGSMIKPDIAAPAVEVSLAQKSLPGELRIGKGTGTALAAAVTAGGIALFLQWAYEDGRLNYIRGSDVKSFLIRGAVREDNLVYPNKLWGYGKLSVQGIFNSLIHDSSG